jgi:hypothetical protein
MLGTIHNLRTLKDKIGNFAKNISASHIKSMSTGGATKSVVSVDNHM